MLYVTWRYSSIGLGIGTSIKQGVTSLKTNLQIYISDYMYSERMSNHPLPHTYYIYSMHRIYESELKYIHTHNLALTSFSSRTLMKTINTSCQGTLWSYTSFADPSLTLIMYIIMKHRILNLCLLLCVTIYTIPRQYAFPGMWH